MTAKITEDENGNLHMVVHKYKFDTGTQVWCIPGLKVAILTTPNGKGWQFTRKQAAELLREGRKAQFVKRIP